MNLFRRLYKWSQAHPARAAVLAGWYQQGCTTLGAIIAIPFILKLLGQSDAGLWFSLQGVLAMVGLADFGFSMAISRQAAHSLGLSDTKQARRTPDLIETRPGWSGVSEIYASSRVIFWRVTAAAAVMLIFLYEAVLPFTKLIEGRSAGTALVWYALGASILLNLQTRLSQSFLDGIGFMFLGRIISGSYSLVWNLGSVIALLLRPGLLGMSLVVLGFSIIQLVAMHLALVRIAGRQIDFAAPRSTILIKHLWKVALPFGFVNSGTYLIGAVQVPLLGSILGPAAVAPYYLAARISQTLHAAVQQVTTTQLPHFTQQCAAGHISEAKTRMSRTIGIGVVLYTATTLFFYFGSPALVNLWVGPGQYIGRDVLLLFAVNFLIAGVAVVPAHFVLASGSNPFPLTILIQGLLTIGGVLLLCPVIGIAGVPLSSLAAGLATNYWYFVLKGWQMWRSLTYRPTVCQDDLSILAEIENEQTRIIGQ
jgi:O-antigen/teichoic acid export membrane protein